MREDRARSKITTRFVHVLLKKTIRPGREGEDTIGKYFANEFPGNSCNNIEIWKKKKLTISSRKCTDPAHRYRDRAIAIFPPNQFSHICIHYRMETLLPHSFRSTTDPDAPTFSSHMERPTDENSSILFGKYATPEPEKIQK